ncbi:dynamin family protein [Calothrix sp. FACHB-1219]|uniref:dynamin family protein n=1 Tax=unclassified Calothrix TaxID=2619626 RepID=UPI001687E6FA|nr:MULTISPECIES: dynamin family protein [unclassified Calothrix]MBD2207433.1 dynamin family protein [Calothrix sp. FACHB-168]MBD2222009.1 dynamin family protein [Calothrix sp. FACHB-1219]
MTATSEQHFQIGSVIEHKKIEQTLINDLRKLQEFSAKLKLTKSVELIDEVLKRIAERTFSVAIVGEFKRGKSTFINALLGKDILPSDILPCSATLNRVTYGITPSVEIVFKDEKTEKIPIDRLTDYVTKLTPESELKAESIKEAIVEYPIPYCQNGIEVIDTPGLNDDHNMTEVTLSVLPEVDAAIMVILAQSPFSEFERDLLENKLLTNDLGRVIFVVNIWDNYTPEQAERVLASVKSRIQKYVFSRIEEDYGKDSEEYKNIKQKIGEPKVFGLYIKQALEAKQKGDDALLTQSGFKNFETALEKFLTQERGVILLQVPANRAIASSTEILKTLDIQESSLQMKQEEFQVAYDNSVAEIEAIRNKQTEEMKLIDRSAEDVKYRVRPLINQLPDELKQAATKAIDQANIDSKGLKNIKKLTENLGKEVSKSVQKAGQKLSEKIQLEIQQGLAKEVERLSEFVEAVDQALNNIEMQFVQIEADATRKRGAGAHAAAAAIAVFTGLGGVYTGYREAGAKGALIGAGGSLGTLFGAGALIGLIGLPLTWPVLIAAILVSTFTGGWLAKVVGGGDRVETFKENFKQKVLEEITKQLQDKHLEQTVNNHIYDTFDALKQKVRQEVDSLLDNTQNTLAELRGQRERNEVLTESQCQEFAQIRAETERILGNAQRLSEELVEIRSV